MVILLGVPKRGWSFIWAGLREDVHSPRHAQGLTHCQAQSRLGLASARPSVPEAWHTTKLSAPSLRCAYFPENLYP